MSELLLQILAGLAVGTVVGLTGVGGGSLMTPLLVGPFAVPMPLAIGTDLWFSGVTKGWGAAIGLRARLIDARLLGALLAGSLPATLATVAVLHRLPHETTTAVLRVALGFALLLTGLSLVLRLRASPSRPERPVPARRRFALTVAGGVAVGVLTTLSSIGAGAVVMALLLRLYPERDPRELVATDIAHAVPLALVSGTTYALSGRVDWTLLAALLVGSLPGITLGHRIGARMPTAALRGALGVLLGGLGVKYLAAAI